VRKSNDDREKDENTRNTPPKNSGGKNSGRPAERKKIVRREKVFTWGKLTSKPGEVLFPDIGSAEANVKEKQDQTAKTLGGGGPKQNTGALSKKQNVRKESKSPVFRGMTLIVPG